MPATFGDKNSYANRYPHIMFFVIINIFSLFMGLLVGCFEYFCSSEPQFIIPFFSIYSLCLMVLLMAGIFDGWSVEGMW